MLRVLTNLGWLLFIPPLLLSGHVISDRRRSEKERNESLGNCRVSSVLELVGWQRSTARRPLTASDRATWGAKRAKREKREIEARESSESRGTCLLTNPGSNRNRGLAARANQSV
jgi:hypothetical protein